MKGKEGEADRRRGWRTILKSGQEWALPAQLGQPKTGEDGKFICGAPTTFRGYGSRPIHVLHCVFHVEKLSCMQRFFHIYTSKHVQKNLCTRYCQN